MMNEQQSYDAQGKPLALISYDVDGKPMAPLAPVAAPLKPVVPVAGRGTGLDLTGKNRADNAKLFQENAPMIASIIAALVTEGGSIPLQMAATGGAGAAGQLVKDASTDMPAGDRAMSAVTEGGLQAALQGGGETIPKLIGKAGTAVYRGYLKPSLAGKEIAKAKEIVDTAIREWLPVTQSGVDRGKRIIGQLNNEVNQELANATGGVVDLHKIADRVRAWADRTYNRAGAPSSDLLSALKVADEIDAHPSLGYAPGAAGKIANPATATPLQANETKQALDKAIGDTGFGVERNAGTEARKVGRHAAREAIEGVVPAVAGLNKRESEIIDAIETLTRGVEREANKNPLTGWSTMISAGLGMGAGSAMHDPYSGVLSTLVIRGLISPGVASRAAILAAKFAKVPGTGVAQALRMGVLIAGRESEQQK